MTRRALLGARCMAAAVSSWRGRAVWDLLGGEIQLPEGLELLGIPRLQLPDKLREEFNNLTRLTQLRCMGAGCWPSENLVGSKVTIYLPLFSPLLSFCSFSIFRARKDASYSEFRKVLIRISIASRIACVSGN
jgi:hypothetical protein